MTTDTFKHCPDKTSKKKKASNRGDLEKTPLWPVSKMISNSIRCPNNGFALAFGLFCTFFLLEMKLEIHFKFKLKSIETVFSQMCAQTA